MPVFVSMLRGVNLGKRRVKMPVLAAVYKSLGFEDVKTYVQSGNVVFRTKLRDLKKVAKLIEDAIEKEFGFHSDVHLRTTAEMREVVAKNPFAKRKDVIPGKLLVSFLPSAPSASACEKLAAMDIAPEELHVVGREMFIYFPNGQARPRLKWPLVDKILTVTSTGRNWNSVTALLAMAEELEKR
jgi:uncharacterized protein (DUF1697 family)